MSKKIWQQIVFKIEKKQACRCFTVINKNCFMHLKPNIKIGLSQNIFCFPSFFYAAFQINKSDSFPSKIIFCKTFPLYFFKGFFLCEWKYKSTKHTSTTSMVKNRIKNFKKLKLNNFFRAPFLSSLFDFIVVHML